MSPDQTPAPATARRTRPPRVLVAGGGFAALEALLALRDLAEDRVELRLVAAEPRLVYRPAATGVPFDASAVHSFELAGIARDAGAQLRIDRVAAVAPAAHRVRLASGAHLDYDVLLLALGARRRIAIPGATTYRDQRDTPLIARLREELRSGEAESVAFAAPAGIAWTLPLYELALLMAAAAPAAEVALVTPEAQPLEVFGRAASDRVAGLLSERGVRTLRHTHAVEMRRDGLKLRDDGVLRVRRAVAVPRLAGPSLLGLPADWSGFVPTDAFGRVDGHDDVYAVGDMASFPVKQGGLAAQQADAAARLIAARAGAPVAPAPAGHVLRGRLLHGPEALSLRAVLDGSGRPLQDGHAEAWAEEEPLWWPPAKVFARYLSPYLADRTSRVPTR